MGGELVFAQQLQGGGGLSDFVVVVELPSEADLLGLVLAGTVAGELLDGQLEMGEPLADGLPVPLDAGAPIPLRSAGSNKVKARDGRGECVGQGIDFLGPLAAGSNAGEGRTLFQSGDPLFKLAPAETQLRDLGLDDGNARLQPVRVAPARTGSQH